MTVDDLIPMVEKIDTFFGLWNEKSLDYIHMNYRTVTGEELFSVYLDEVFFSDMDHKQLAMEMLFHLRIDEGYVDEYTEAGGDVIYCVLLCCHADGGHLIEEVVWTHSDPELTLQYKANIL